MVDHVARTGDLRVRWSDERLWPQFADLLTADPDALALIDADERIWTRRQLRELADQLHDKLAEAVNPGERVLVLAHKSARTVAAALAVSRLEATFCPISARLGVAERTAIEAALGHRALVDTLASDDTAVHIVQRDAQSVIVDSRAALIGFTSGSTGVPKGVIHGPGALNYATRACSAIAGLQPGDSILAIVPFDSAPGYTFTIHFALSLGHPLVILDPWNPLEALHRAERHRCGWAIAVPTHLHMMVETARLGKWSGTLPFRAMAVGGSPMAADLIADAEHLLDLKVLRMFGMSECMGHCSTSPGHSLEIRQSMDGLPFPGTEEEAFDEQRNPLPRGRRGQAGVKGPSLFLGYAEGMGAGQERFTSDGFYLTGDEIVRSPEGLVRVVGRIKDQIIRGGFNIDPAEVEAVLLRHPAIAAAAVVGVPHRKLGEQACVVCQVREGVGVPEFEALLEHLDRQGLSRKKWPEHLVIVEEMAHTATGKIDKKALAMLAAERLSLDAQRIFGAS